MICGEAQRLMIRKTMAHTPKQMAAARQALREHVKTCEFCQKELSKKKRIIPSKRE